MAKNKRNRGIVLKKKKNHNQKVTRKTKRRKTQPVADSLVQRAWKNINNNASLTSLSAFAKSQKTLHNVRALEKSLSSIEAFSRTRPLRRRFPRPAYILHSPYVGWCTDLAEMPFKNSNKGNRFILILLDMFSKKVNLQKLKRKSKEQTKVAMERAIKQLSNGFQNLPKYILSDGGREWKNSYVLGLFKKHNIEHRVLIHGFKAGQAERFIRSLKSFLFKYMELNKSKTWLPALKIFQDRYNNSPHTATRYAPNSVSEANSGEIFKNLYDWIVKHPRPKARYQVGDTVRIGNKPDLFSKRTKPMFSKEIYKVIKVIDSFPVYSFRVSTLKGEEVDQRFVSQELSPATL